MRGTLVLIGMMGAGKSAVGAELARQLGVPFLDTDDEIERAAAMTVAEIFARDGEAFFRDRETEVLTRLLAGRPAIIAVGGGAWLRPQNRALIDAAGLSVWLDVPADVLWSRVRGRSHRPLLATEDPRATLEALLEERAPVYAEAQLRLPVSAGDSVEATADALRKTITTKYPGFLS